MPETEEPLEPTENPTGPDTNEQPDSFDPGDHTST
jgi:hypothetical protein